MVQAMARRGTGTVAAITALNSRIYAPFARHTIEWEGKPIPTGFGPKVRRLRQAGVRGTESSALDADAAVEAFLYHYRLGIHYGYPECCVLQYAMEVPYISPFLLRGGLTLGAHVPCDRCLEAYLHDYITDGPALHRSDPPTAAVLD